MECIGLHYVLKYNNTIYYYTLNFLKFALNKVVDNLLLMHYNYTYLIRTLYAYKKQMKLGGIQYDY